MDAKKSSAYKNLVRKMQERYPRFGECDAELYAPFVDGEFICREINLYTYWQGLDYAKNTPPIKFLFVAQDFGSIFEGYDFARLKRMNRGERNVPYCDEKFNESSTDKNLFKLFAVLGYDLNRRYSELFFTNFCLGYRREKSVGMTKDWMLRDADLFKELCEILEPENILSMGKRTFECVSEALTGESCNVKNFNAFLESHDEIIFRVNGNPVKIYPLSHCGEFGIINRNENFSPLAPQFRDWGDVKKSVNKIDMSKKNSFAEFLFTLIAAKNMTDPEVYRAANVGRKTFSDIRSGVIPEKTTVIKIIFGLRLSIIDARELLERAGYALSPSDDLDLLAMFFISQRKFNGYAFDEELVKRNLPRIFFASDLYDYLSELMDMRGLKRPDFCKAANIPAKIFTEIWQERILDKEILDKIISALELTPEEAANVFKYARLNI